MKSESESRSKRRNGGGRQRQWGGAPRPWRLMAAGHQGAGDAERRVHPDRHHWKAELQAIIDANNWAHSTLAKNVSYKTREDRAYFLFSMFKTLWKTLPTRMPVMPRNLAHDHVQALVDYWVARQLAAGTIRLYLSYIRTFCDWIGKRGMVREPEYYVADAALVTRVYAAKEDRGWESRGVASTEIVERAWQLCPFTACQLQMAMACALRPKEARMIRPHLAECDGYLMVTTIEDDARYGKCLEVERGTKGGRVRWIPIDTPEKRAALEAARRLVSDKNGHLGVPGRSLAWNRRHFYTICEKLGLTRKQLGVTAYGARHQYAGDRYQKSTGEPPPVRGGKPVDRAVDKAARLRVAGELGHSRESVTTAYLGGVQRAKRGN